MIEKPTQEQWDICLDCLQAYKMHLERTEPSAIRTVNVLDHVLAALPGDAVEAFDE